jgi:hypothetical protein
MIPLCTFLWMVSYGKSRSFSHVSSIKTFDFSTLYTTLPHDKLKTRLKETTHKAFSHRNYSSKFVALGYNSTNFSNKIQKGKTTVSQYFCCPYFTADRIFVRWIDNSFVEQVDDPAMYLSLNGVLWRLGIRNNSQNFQS